jgi:molybdopterin converting factor subunit 1
MFLFATTKACFIYFKQDCCIFVYRNQFMEISVLAFGIAKDIFGGPTVTVELTDAATTADLKARLEAQYPRLKQLASYMVAVNNEYAQDEGVITERDEVAIIPPVSGG